MRENRIQDESRRSGYEGRKKKNQKHLNWLLIIKIALYVLILILSIWAWNRIVEKGYIHAKNYVDTAIEHVRQENALNVQQLQERMDLLSSEMKALRGAIENTDDTLSGSANIQKDIESRLESLDEQLVDLERSIKILREAP